jgi:hypothetical protein
LLSKWKFQFVEYKLNIIWLAKTCVGIYFLRGQWFPQHCLIGTLAYDHYPFPSGPSIVIKQHHVFCCCSDWFFLYAFCLLPSARLFNWLLLLVWNRKGRRLFIHLLFPRGLGVWDVKIMFLHDFSQDRQSMSCLLYDFHIY